MIQTKKDLRLYLKEDGIHYTKVQTWQGRLMHTLVTNPINCQTYIWLYIKALRYAEYHQNNSILNGMRGVKGYYHTLMMTFYYRKMRLLSFRTGFQIPPNVCGPGLRILHYGTIVINPQTRIGNHATFCPGVLIGDKKGSPVIGHNVFFGPGCKVIAPVQIGDHVAIAQNAVVIKDVPNHCAVGGVPAKIINSNFHPIKNK